MFFVKNAVLFAGASVIATGSAMAQAVPDAKSVDAPEIIVTAQKREQSLQDVPLSIAAIGGEEFSKQAQVRLDEATAGIPNLKITEGATGNTINMRGIGTSQGNAGLEQSVATFSDGVYVGRARLIVAPLADIERVEILRGPQPVYFGQNAVAGAISIQTRDGRGPLGANGSISYGNGDDLTVEGGVTLPIVDDVLGVRIAARFTDRSGFATNIFTGDDVGGLETSLYRVSVNFAPSESLKIRLKYEKGYSEQDGVSSEIVSCGDGGRVPGSPPAVPCTQASLAPPAGFGVGRAYLPEVDQLVATGAVQTLAGVTVTGEAFQPALDITRSDLWSGQMDYDLGKATITAITAYGKFDYSARRDIDGTPYAVIHPILEEGYKQFSQEIRLTSNEGLFGGVVDYLLGGYYQDALITTSNKTFTTLSPTASGTVYESDERYLTAFGGLTLNLSGELRVNVGGRYSSITKEASTFAIYAPQTPATNSDVTFATHASVVADPTCGAGVIRANSDANPATLETQCLSQIRKADNFDYQIGVQFDVSDDVMLFASHSNAFKSGGFSQNGAGLTFGATNEAALNAFSYDDESADSFELGFKGRFFDRRVRLNATAFLTKYNELQVTSVDVLTAAFRTQNAASATTKGIEFDGDVRISKNLSFEFSGSILDAKFNSYLGAQCGQYEQSLNLNGCTFDLDRDGLVFGINPGEPASDTVSTTDRSGYKLLFSPNWTLNIGLKANFPISEILEFGINANASFTDEYQVSDRYDPRGLVDGFGRVNARAELAARDGKWALSVFGNNLTDRKPLIAFGPSQLTGQRSGFALTSRGRSYGLQFRWKLGN